MLNFEMIKNKVQIVQIVQFIKIERSELRGLNAVIRMERFLLFLLLTSNFVLLICGPALEPYGSGQAWGAAAVDTLYPNDDFEMNWYPSSGNLRYPMIDDPAGSPDDWETYVWSNANNLKQRFTFDSTSLDPDSVIAVIRVWRTGGGNDTDSLEVGWSAYSEGIWSWIPDDTVRTTLTITSFSHKFSGSWTNYDVNHRKYGFKTLVPEEVQYVTQMYLLVYGQEPEGEAKKQGGIVQDDNNRGIAEGGIAR